MRPLDRLPYHEIWGVDFEFSAPPGERPVPICMVARELRTGRTIRVWQDELRRMSRPPYPTGPDALFVAFYASAELGCHIALNWPMPARILDLFTEFRAATNGLPTVAGASLLGALASHGLDGMASEEKAEMIALALRGGPYSGEERAALLVYCEADVDALARLLPAMLPGILARVPDPTMALGQALLRGRYMAAAARMEWNGNVAAISSTADIGAEEGVAPSPHASAWLNMARRTFAFSAGVPICSDTHWAASLMPSPGMVTGGTC